jgi:4-amino-4-deoxychorismate lyase
MKELIFIDGKKFKERFPLRSLFFGEGLFETFRWKKSLPVLFNKHIERMKKGAHHLGIPFPGEEVIKERLDSALISSQASDSYVKLCLLSEGSTTFYEMPRGYSLLIIVREYHPPKERVKAFVSSFRRSSTSPIRRLKSLNYMENIIARREAMVDGFDEAIFLNDEGDLSEGSTSNIFWLKEGILFTPSVDCGLLPGVIRGFVVELARDMGMKVIEGKYNLDSFVTSEAGFITNSLIGAIAVSHVNDFSLSDSKDFERISTALFDKLGWV